MNTEEEVLFSCVHTVICIKHSKHRAAAIACKCPAITLPCCLVLILAARVPAHHLLLPGLLAPSRSATHGHLYTLPLPCQITALAAQPASASKLQEYTGSVIVGAAAATVLHNPAIIVESCVSALQEYIGSVIVGAAAAMLLLCCCTTLQPIRC